ncbi:hypothetical protein PV327_009127 [Microctonus hyperodae]|uniref:BRCT domain-containing protein n=1 Tax=Microctonus hyperodae TaxID=165561 RepID=A0AA39KVE2_MICHY|nr:hypothetical protein PV327_009127 [Microctonus hyperodae]
MYRKKSKRYENKKTDIKTRRSSLQVNLSYTFDLSDSENTDKSQSTSNKNHNEKNPNKTNKSLLSINNDISCVLANISDKDEALSKNCTRLRNAILNKTRELFDKQNTFCQMTTKILENSPVTQSNDKHKSNCASPILQNNRTSINVITKLSPRKTRSTTMRERLNSFVAPMSITNETINNISTIGSPIICSTFVNHDCDNHESCDVKKMNSDKIKSPDNSNKSQTQLKMNITQEISTTPKLKGKPLIRNIQMCNLELDKIEGFQKHDKSKTLREVPMELTNIQGNCILNKSSFIDRIIEKNIPPINSVISLKASSSTNHSSSLIEDLPSNEHLKANYSMRVNTSLDRKSNCNKEGTIKAGKTTCENVHLKPDSMNANESEEAGGGDGTDMTIQSSSESDDNFEDDVSLIQRQRNISMKNSPEKCITPERNKNNNGIPDVIECTPLSVTRSMLLRTQAKLISIEEKTKSQYINISETKTNQPDSNININVAKAENTIVIDTTLGANNCESKLPIIIEDSPDSSEDELSQAAEQVNNVKAITKKVTIRKKKLFTQHEDSGPASFSPLTNDVRSPEITRLKRIKRRRIKRNVAGRIIKPHSMLRKSQHPVLTQVVLTSSSASSQDFDKSRDFEKSQKKKRLIKSKKIVVKKQLNTTLLNRIDKIRDRSFDGDPRSSRSPNVFMKQKRISIKRHYGKQKIIIVSTGLCNRDKNLVKDMVKTLGGAIMDFSVTRKTTHIVTTGVRTINLLRGIIRGCWLVKFDWIKESVKAGEWLPAEKYEIDHFSKAVKENRRDREIFGNSYVPDLFATCGLIYIEDNTTPPKEILKELIRTAGGLITEEPKKSRIIIGHNGIKENWILDSITTGELQSVESYENKNKTKNTKK